MNQKSRDDIIKATLTMKLHHISGVGINEREELFQAIQEAKDWEQLYMAQQKVDRAIKNLCGNKFVYKKIYE